MKKKGFSQVFFIESAPKVSPTERIPNKYYFKRKSNRTINYKKKEQGKEKRKTLKKVTKQSSSILKWNAEMGQNLRFDPTYFIAKHKNTHFPS